MSKTQSVTLQVTLNYTGGTVDPATVKDLLQNAMDHCRQEHILEDEGWAEISCDSADVVLKSSGMGTIYRDEITE